MHTLTRVDAALNLRRALDAGALFTPLAEAMSGQTVTADVERLGPPVLAPDEAEQLGMTQGESWAALRRAGHLTQADGTRIARIGSVIAVGRISDETFRMLTTTSIPLGKALGDQAHTTILWSSPGIDGYAVHCGRLILVDGLPVALTVDRVLWSWLDGLRHEGEDH